METSILSAELHSLLEEVYCNVRQPQLCALAMSCITLNSIGIHVKLDCSRGLYLKCIYCHCCHQSAVIFICTALDNGTTVDRVYIWTPSLLRSAHLQICVMGLKSNLLPSIRWRGPVQVSGYSPFHAFAIPAQHMPPQGKHSEELFS